MSRRGLYGVVTVALVLACCGPGDQEIGPPRLAISRLVEPTGLVAKDTPGDKGSSITLAWNTSPTENMPAFMILEEIKRRQFKAGITEEEKKRIRNEVEAIYAAEPSIEYRIYSEDRDGSASWSLLAAFPSSLNFKKEGESACDFRESGGDKHFFEVKKQVDGSVCRFRVDLAMGDEVVHVLAEEGGPDPHVVSASSRPNWFDRKKLNLLVVVAGLIVILLVFIHRARLNPNMFIRKIPGVDAVDNAIGRATEMGKPIYYFMGLGLLSDLPTLASMSILQRIAQQAAKNDIPVKVPCFDPMVMSVAQDVVREAYLSQGKEASKDDVFFVTSDKFSYAASVDGLLIRDKPGTTFLMGYFEAESLLLSEVGSNIGALQISGTDQPAQLPFFVATTDYTLIGEELYAASAYLSRNPLFLGSLRGQDVGKVLLGAAIIVGTVLTTLNIDTVWRFFS